MIRLVCRYLRTPIPDLPTWLYLVVEAGVPLVTLCVVVLLFGA